MAGASSPDLEGLRYHPKATLTLPSQRDVVYIGDTRECDIQGSPIKDVTGQTYTIQSVTQSDSGAYWCKADRNDPTHHLQNSNAVTLSVKELFTKPSLTVHPSTTLWQGDSVTLRCQSESLLQGTQLRYKFYRDEEPVSQRASESEFTIPSARPEKSGSYWCEVEEEGKKTEKKTSERVQVTVRASSLPIILGCVGSFLFLLILLLFVYHKTRGLPCFESKTARRKDKRMDVNTPGGGAVQMEAINEKGSKTEVFYSELVNIPKTKKKGMPPVNSSPAAVYSEVKVHQGGSTASNCDVLYSEIIKGKTNEKQGKMLSNSPQVVYSGMKFKNSSGASPAASSFSLYE
ncbi:carcinoembryonic antigen-related cell adhesion molecule 1-like [Polypterus senegalus]|uniref:carcinoembryonic antigen-related cell adhesion molecule 1-like n=1 Tax=Polypterus senegalus TaxID=55291 RepID=UPI00196693C8|nr:carcinoembryonic antigen-related cell adhesion molecule 1-like [Polypterus senegalus]